MRAQLVRTLVTVIFLVAGLTAVAAPANASAPPSPWYQAGWNQSRTGDNPVEASLTSANANGLHQVWSKQTPEPCCVGPAATSIVSSAGIAYYGGADNNLYAVDAVTGAARWHVSTPGCFLGRDGLAIHLGVLVVPTQECSPDDFNSWLSGYNPSTGAHLWSFESVGSMSSPVTVNGRAFVQSLTDSAPAQVRLDAVNVHNGVSEWHKVLGSAVVDIALDSTNLYLSSAAHLSAYNPASGAPRWAKTVPGGRVLTSNGHVITSGFSGGQERVTSYSSAGTRQWAIARIGPSDYQLSATASELVLATSTGSVAALALGSGSATWHTTLAGGMTNQPAIAGGVVYVPIGTSSSASIYALRDGTGAVLWSFTSAVAADSSEPSVADGTLFVSLGGTGLERAFRP